METCHVMQELLFMKRLLLILLCTLTFSLLAKSQGGKGEKSEALKIAFITKQLQLTPDEAKAFWPVYDVYEADLRKTMREHREKGGSQLELDEKIVNLRKKSKPSFLKVISEEKFDKLMRAENALREMILKELQRRQENRGQRAGKE